MKYFFTCFIILLLLSTTANADIKVKSFRKINGDSDAKGDYQMKDRYGFPCAIIKVKSAFKDFTFTSGWVVSTKTHDSEIWVYVSSGISSLTIYHPKFGQLSNYRFPVPIERGCVYDLVIRTSVGNVGNASDVGNLMMPAIKPKFAIVNFVSPGSKLYIDGEFKANDRWSYRLPAGAYKFEARREGYRSDQKTITMNAGDSIPVTLTPIPIYGKLNVTTTPQDAEVYINGIKSSTTSPTTIQNVIIGTYDVKLVKRGYGTVTKQVKVEEGVVSTLEATLPDKKEIRIVSDPLGANVYIDNELVGKTPYSASLTYGVHKLFLANGKVTLTKELDITDDSPAVVSYPVFAERRIRIETNPLYLSLYINNKYVGATPYNVTLREGKHTIRIESKNKTKTDKIDLSKTSRSIFRYGMYPSKTQGKYAISVGYPYSNQTIRAEHKPFKSFGADVKLEYKYLYINPYYLKASDPYNNIDYLRLSAGFITRRIRLFNPISINVFGGVGYEYSRYKNQIYINADNYRYGDIIVGRPFAQAGSFITIDIHRHFQLYGTVEYIIPFGTATELNSKIDKYTIDSYSNSNGFVTTFGLRFELGLY